MFDYTRAIYTKTKKELDLALTLFQFGTQILYIAYLIYLVIRHSEVWYLYLSLLIIATAFLIFDAITTSNIRSMRSKGNSPLGNKERKEKLYRAKKKRRNIRKIKFYVSHAIKLLVLSSSLYPIIASPYNVHPLTIICTTVMAFMWIMQIAFEVLRLILEDRGELFIEAMHADVEFITKPVNSVKNTFRRIIGKDVEEEGEPTKERTYLDSMVKKFKSEKAAEKAENKAERDEKLSDWLDSHVRGFKRKMRENDKRADTIVLSEDDAEDKTEI